MAAPIPPPKPAGFPMPGSESLADLSSDSAASPPPWRRALVYGLGVSGVAVSRLLLDRGVGVLGVDDRASVDLPADLVEDSRFVLVAAEALDPEALDPEGDENVDVVVLSPGVPKERPIVRRALDQHQPVIGEVEIAFQLLRETGDGAVERIVGITGSNGKSTTTEMVAALLAPNAAACGNIGVPFSDCVREATAAGRLESGTFVIELSSFQLDDIEEFRAPVAALLNISPDHQDRHGTASCYLEAKRRIFLSQVTGDLAVLNADDEAVATTRLNPGVRRRHFSLQGPVKDGCYLDGNTVFLVEPGGEPVSAFAPEDLGVVGEHNLANAMAAVLLALPLGLELSSVPEILSRFTGLPHRTQLVASSDGVHYYDDSKGTNVGATAKSLAGFSDGSVHLIAGGLAKGGGFALLREAVAAKVACLYLVGEAAGEMERDLGDLVPVEQVETIEKAVRSASNGVVAGQVVLLSPACASFDQYANFAERGLAFQREVQRSLAGSCETAAEGSNLEGAEDG